MTKAMTPKRTALAIMGVLKIARASTFGVPANMKLPTGQNGMDTLA